MRENQVAKLLKIVSDAVDIVLIAVEDDYDEAKVIQRVVEDEIAQFDGEIIVGDWISIPSWFVDLNRPFMG